MKRFHRFLRWSAIALGVLALLAVSGALYEPIAEARDASSYPPPGQLVDVGGYRLHLNCTGTGSPTVIIASGLGDWSTGWAWVQPEVAKTTRVCTYDSAGAGWSEPGPRPRTSRQTVHELHAALAQSGVAPPYVLVGHSLGGLTARVFTGEYPAEVAGLVLVDSMHPGAAAASEEPVHTPVEDGPSLESIFPALARIGFVRLIARPIGLAPHLPEGMSASYTARAVRANSVQATLDEARGIPESMQQARAVASLGALPLTVLSRGLREHQDEVWQAQQTSLLSLSSRSQQLFADKSGHGIPIEQPEAAVNAIAEMVRLVR